MTGLRCLRHGVLGASVYDALTCLALILVCCLAPRAAFTVEPVCDISQSAALTDNAMLWRLEKQGHANHYLLGTLHVDGPWVELMLEDLSFVFDRTERLFLELDMDGLTQLELAQHMLLPEPHSLPDFFTSTEYETLRRLLYGRLDHKRLIAMKPWVAFAELYSVRANGDRTMDELLSDQYRQDRKSVKGLETVSRQLSVFDTLTFEQQAALVKRALRLYEQHAESLRARLFKYYKRGDLKSLWALQTDFVHEMGELFEPLHHGTLAGRNHDMVKTFLSFPRLSSSLIAVGALHLPGTEGLVCLFEQRGYRLIPFPMDKQGGFRDRVVPRPGMGVRSP